MKIFEYEIKGTKVCVTEQEAKEENKTYICHYNGIISRVNKSDIGVLSRFYRMFLLERNDKYFISAVIARKEKDIKLWQETIASHKREIKELEAQAIGGE